MLKLIIADDERIIRETISNLINWNSIGIELVGLCKDGIEAYNMILDESPDIVLTDIKMPGLNGLELVQRISQTDLNTQFILLSGYGEFAYAKEAMKYGIRHYLLKPCNEEQIITCVQEVVEDCYHKRAFRKTQEQQKLLMENLHNNIIASIINEGILSETIDSRLFSVYDHFLDFSMTGYELCYLYFLEKENLTNCLQSIYEYHRIHAPGIPVHGIYVQNTLLVFFQSYQRDYRSFDAFAQSLAFPSQTVNMEYKRVSYQNLRLLLTDVLTKVRRFGTIYCMNGYRAIPTSNYHNLIQKVEELSSHISTCEYQSEELEELIEILNSISNTDFLKQLVSSLMIKFSSNTEACSPVIATEFLLAINQQEDIDTIRTMVQNKLEELLREMENQSCKKGDFIDSILQYVNDHLSDPNLTLKWIAENYLYMNVDYVSKKFIRETGQKFSNYLTDLRVQKAKEMLAEGDSEKIQLIAERVGCGNNPQYFSQIFRKNTGMTPSAYVKMINGGTQHEL